jgi:hypothetical protein
MTALVKHSTDNQPHGQHVDIGAIRDEACARAKTILPELAVQAGFRFARGQRKTLHCIHAGGDRSPSARLYEGHIHCFACGGHWSPLDLVMLRDGSTFITALKALAEETFVPWPDISEAERERRRVARELAPQIAVRIEDWANGLRLWAESRKADLMECLQWSWETGQTELARHCEKELSRLSMALSINSVNPKTITATFAHLQRTSPERVKRFEEMGRGDREHAEQVTREVCNMLAVSRADQHEVVN